MGESIETVRKNGEFLILEDELSGRYAVARWSAEAEAWVDDSGAPCRINPTHWQPLEREIHVVDSLEDIEAVVLPGGAAKSRSKPTRHVLSRFAIGRTFARPSQDVNGSDSAPSKNMRFSAVMALKNMRFPAVAGLRQAAQRVRNWGEAVLKTTVKEAALLASLARSQLAPRRREIALAAACLISVAAAGWWLYRVEVATRGAAAVQPGTSANSDAALAKQALQQQQEKAEKLAGELATARREAETRAATANSALGEATRAKEAAERAAAELRQALQQQQAKAEKLAGELAAARREATTQAATGDTALGEAIRAKEAAEQAAAELRQALQQQQEKADKLAGELATVRRDATTQAATANTSLGEATRAKEAAEQAAAELRQALQQQQEKAEKLAGELAAARREAETEATTKAADEAAQTQRLARLQQTVQAAEATKREAQESLTRERARNQELEQQLAALRDGALPQDRGPSAATSDSSGQTPPPATDKPATASPPASDQAAVAARPATPQAPANAEAVRLLARASLLLEEGNIGAARNMLDQAVEMGSAQALFALAETYDPTFLSARQAFGTLSDPAKARELYTKALAGGVGEAKDRLHALRQ